MPDMASSISLYTSVWQGPACPPAAAHMVLFQLSGTMKLGIWLQVWCLKCVMITTSSFTLNICILCQEKYCTTNQLYSRIMHKLMLGLLVFGYTITPTYFDVQVLLIQTALLYSYVPWLSLLRWRNARIWGMCSRSRTWQFLLLLPSLWERQLLHSLTCSCSKKWSSCVCTLEL